MRHADVHETIDENIADLLADPNACPSQERVGSRFSVFAKQEAPFLQPLSGKRFDITRLSPKAKEPTDYHLQCVKM